MHHNNTHARTHLLTAAFVTIISFSTVSTQAFSLPWSSPEYKISTGLYDMWAGACKIGSGFVDAVSQGLSKGATATGVTYAWKSNKELTAIGLIAATALTCWGVYRYGKSRGKTEMARSIARSVENEQGEHRYF